MNDAINVRLNIKPVFAQVVHSGVYEGPCRVGDEKSLSPAAERAAGEERFGRFCADLKKNLTREANMLKPVYIEYGEKYRYTMIPRRKFEKLEADLQETDLFLISYRVPGIERYKKPVAMVGPGTTNVDMATYLRSRGLEGYAPLDFDELNRLISLLRVRKAISQTKILIVSGGDPISVGSSLWDLETLKRRFGIGHKYISFKEFLDEMDGVMRSDTEQKKVEETTDRLIKNAQRIHMKKDYVIRSVDFYLAAKNLMERYECNAFTIQCFELCATKVPADRKVTPCLTHTLLKDEGYPSACEGDMSALLTMMLLMYVSKKSAYMGNSYLANKEKDVIAVHHDVPGFKMKGLDGSDLPYEIRNFTVGGWGATIRYDFSRDKGEDVTLARLDPSATKLLMTKGEIAGCGGFNEVGCSLRAYIKVPSAIRLLHKEVGFGHHLAMVYGDYTQELRETAKLIGVKVSDV